MYTIIQNSTLDFKISNGAFKCYVYLTSMCYGEKETCFPSQKYLAEKLNRSVRTIQRYLNELISCNLIESKRRGSISNVYRIVGKAIMQKAQNMLKDIKGNKKKSYNKNYKKKESTFNNFPQREYDFEELERKLLHRE